MHIAEARRLFLDQTDGEVLLASVLGKDRTWIFAHDKEQLTPKQEAVTMEYARRHGIGEPVQYILGRAPFYGREFLVNRSTLIPRPATEGLVSLALEWLEKPEDMFRETDSEICALALQCAAVQEMPKTVIDIGTGTGCIGISMALARPDLAVIMTDISGKALATAEENAGKLGAGNAEFRQGSLLDPVADLQEPFIVVSNPPYIPSGIVLEKNVADFEPHEALFAGERGLDVLLPLTRAAMNNPHCAGILLECRLDQVADIAAVTKRPRPI